VTLGIGDEYLWRDSKAKVKTESWNHAAVTADFTAGVAVLYLNGEKVYLTNVVYYLSSLTLTLLC